MGLGFRAFSLGFRVGLGFRAVGLGFRVGLGLRALGLGLWAWANGSRPGISGFSLGISHRRSVREPFGAFHDTDTIGTYQINRLNIIAIALP